MFKPYLITTAHQKVLDFFINHPGRSFYGVELSKQTRLSSSAVNNVLKDLHKDGILHKIQRGRTDLYSLKDNQGAIIRQLKILSTLLRLEDLVGKLKPISHKIILYGSASRGDNDEQSDIDLLIVTTKADKPAAEQLVETFQKKENLPKIQKIVKTTAQWATLEDNDPTYFKEVLKGITLWDSLTAYDDA